QHHEQQPRTEPPRPERRLPQRAQLDAVARFPCGAARRAPPVHENMRGMDSLGRVTGAHALLRTLRRMGVEKIFASPGSDWAPLWEALASPSAREEFPQYLSSRHEETAIAMASGYAKSTGKLPAVVLHTTVGALHATMGMRAALHERIPMV